MDNDTPSLTKTLANYKKTFSNLKNLLTSLPNWKNLPFILLGLAIAYYVVTFSWLSILAHLNYETGAHDIGVYDQAIWLLSRFLPPYTTLGGSNLLAIHASFYCFFFAPFFWLWNNVNILYIIQSLLLGLAAIPIYLYATKKLDNQWAALIVGLTFLLYPALQNMNLENFHPEATIVFFFAFALYFMLTGQTALFYLFTILSLLGKEDMGVTFFLIGLFLCLIKKEKKTGVVILLLSASYYLLANRLILPLANGIDPLSGQQPLVYSHWFGDIGRNLLNPAYYWQSFFNQGALIYYFELLKPLVFIPLLSPSLLLLGLGQLLINLLSNCGYFTSIYYHYNYVIIAVLFFAFIDGLSRFKKAAMAVCLIVLGFACLANGSLSKFPLTQHWSIILQKTAHLGSETVQLRNSGLALIPSQAGVSASYSLYPQLSHRKNIFIFPNPFQEAFRQPGEPLPPLQGNLDYIAIVNGNHSDDDKMLIRYFLNSAFFKKLFREDDVLVIKYEPPTGRHSCGVNYQLYQLDQPIAPYEDFSLNGRLTASGRLAMLYFPDSAYYFRNLLGEEIKVRPPFALEFIGLLFIPATDQYRFNLRTEAAAELAIDDQLVNGLITLKRGFHRYRLKYVNNGQRYNLGWTIQSSTGLPEIISDQTLLLPGNPAALQNLLNQYQQREKLIAKQAQKQPKLLFNGDFEQLYGEIPRAWRIECWQDANTVCDYKADKTVKKSGRFSAKIEQLGKADSRWVQEVNLKPGANYLLSGWIKTEAISAKGGGAFLEVEGTSIRTKAIFGTNGWQYVEASGWIGRDKNRVKVLCRLGDYGATNTGTAYFDNIELKPLRDEQ